MLTVTINFWLFGTSYQCSIEELVYSTAFSKQVLHFVFQINFTSISLRSRTDGLFCQSWMTSWRYLECRFKVCNNIFWNSIAKFRTISNLFSVISLFFNFWLISIRPRNLCCFKKWLAKSRQFEKHPLHFYSVCARTLTFAGMEQFTRAAEQNFTRPIHISATWKAQPLIYSHPNLAGFV